MPVKILAADDSATMRQILQKTFAGEDAEVVTVESGQAAVERARDVHPDVVIADTSMDGMDGYEVARALKGSGASVAVIVLTSQHHPFDEERGKGAGVDDHVAKPFDTQVLIDKVSQVLGRPRAMPAGGPAVAAAPPRPPGPPPPPPAARPPAPPAPPAVPMRSGSRATVAFGTPVAATPAAAARPAAAAAERPVLELADEEAPTHQVHAAPAAAPKPAPAPAAKPAPVPAAAPSRAAAAATSPGSAMAGSLGDLGLTADQIEAVLKLSREVIERVVWEVVPDLAETIIREEIRRLTAE